MGKLLLFVVLVILMKVNYGQDTIRIYFAYGSSKLDVSAERILQEIPKNYDLEEIERVEIVGYADSVGNVRANLRLSEKRAKNTARKCSRFLNNSLEPEIGAKGEGSSVDQSENRREEVIIHYPDFIETEEPVEVIENADPRCFYVDFDALKYCNMREITKGKRKYVYLEALDVDLFRVRKHYYAFKNYKGEVSIRRVRWKRKRTGRLWWRKTRWVATIPKASFDQYQFFTFEDAPCSGCTEEIFTKDTIIMTVNKSYPDYFIMDNLQAKLPIFRTNQVKVRVTKEYINPEESYYISYRPETGQISRHGINNTIDWTEKKWGKKRRDYYYTKLYLYDSKMPYIMRSRRTTKCYNEYEGSGFGGYDMNCAGAWGDGWALGLMGSLEPGIFYHNDTLTSYLAVGLTFVNHTNINIQGGINHRRGFYGAFNFKYPFVSFRLSALSSSNSWGNPYIPSENNFRSPFIHAYVGLDTKTSFSRKYQSFFEGNLHLGAMINLNILGIYPEFYIQFGAAYDFMQRINTQVYPYGQFGIRFTTRNFI